MHPAVKVLIGALMIVVGAYSSITFSDQLINLVLGGVGPILILLGAFIVWLESDEWKMQRNEKQQKATGLQEQLQNAQSMRKDQKEQQREQAQTPQSQSQQNTVQTDYSQVVEGTVDEAKDAVRQMEEPNYDALIAAEQRDKGRKTLLQWLERQKQ